MSEKICRLCAKIIPDKDPIRLFDNQNKNILLQIKDLTGVRLKNTSAFPKCMCRVCKKHLLNAYKFREDFLRVQASFRVNRKKQNKNGLIEATEFVQVFIIKEVNEIDDNENVSTVDKEKEINVDDSDDFNRKLVFRKESRDEVNALEIKDNEENMLEDTKIAIEELIDDTTYKAFSEDEALDNNDSDEDFNLETEILTAKKSSCKSESKKPDCSPTEGKTIARKRKITRMKKKIKDAKDPKVLICDQCGNHFNCRQHFVIHLRRHSGDRRYACELCPEKFFTSSEVTRHMRRHTGERPFACKYCDRRFTDLSTRNKHERTHTNERPFPCFQCGKSFTTSSSLKDHMLTHTGEKLFKCDVCDKSFTRKTHLVVHFRSIMHKQAVENAQFLMKNCLSLIA